MAANRQLVFTRVFDTPRELVYEAWTDPRQVIELGGTERVQDAISEMDVRPGRRLAVYHARG